MPRACRKSFWRVWIEAMTANAKHDLSIEEISPTVDLADCWRYGANKSFRYGLPFHHLILVESGSIRAKPPGGEFDARAGDLICFRPALVNEYLVREPTTFYQAVIQFAPPPHDKWTPTLGELGPLPTQ